MIAKTDIGELRQKRMAANDPAFSSGIGGAGGPCIQNRERYLSGGILA